MTQIVERTILFADLRGSTSLYRIDGQRRGDGGGHAALRGAAGAHRRIDGRPGSSRRWATARMAMFILPRRRSPRPGGDARLDGAHRRPRQFARHQPLKVQVALAGGEVVQIVGDFGDAVNVAPGCSTTPATTRPCSPPRCSPACRRRSAALPQPRAHELQGASSRYSTCSEAQRNPATPATAFGDMRRRRSPKASASSGRRRTASTAAPTCRWCSDAARVTYCIDDTRVSRRMRIDWHGGTFQLTDLSYNGTARALRPRPRGDQICAAAPTLRQRPDRPGHATHRSRRPLRALRVMKFADTQPHDLYL